MDGGAHEKYESLMFKRPQAPELDSYRETIGGALITAQPDRAFRAKYREYEVAEAAWQRARELRELKHAMDGVSVSMAIAATCGPQISTRIGQVFGTNAELQPKVLWKFLVDTTRAILLPARERLLTEMQNMRMGADESLDMYIARFIWCRPYLHEFS